MKNEQNDWHSIQQHILQKPSKANLERQDSLSSGKKLQALVRKSKIYEKDAFNNLFRK